jgi:uncharacterized membrane protein
MSSSDAARRHPSRWLTMLGLGAIPILILYPAPTPWTLTIAIPPLILLALGLRPPPKWGGWVAALIIPYFAGAMGEAVAAPESSLVNWTITLITIVVFLSALYFVRQSGESLRR